MLQQRIAFAVQTVCGNWNVDESLDNHEETEYKECGSCGKNCSWNNSVLELVFHRLLVCFIFIGGTAFIVTWNIEGDVEHFFKFGCKLLCRNFAENFFKNGKNGVVCEFIFYYDVFKCYAYVERIFRKVLFKTFVFCVSESVLWFVARFGIGEVR